MTHSHLSDYEIAINFGDTLQIIYKAKMEELNNDLQEAYDHIDRLKIPQVPELHRYFAMESMPGHIKERFRAVEHIQKIRNMYKKINKNPEELNIQKAKLVPITSLYDFTVKKNMVNCVFHIDKTASMKINKDNTLHCFSCGWHGDTISLWMKLNNKGFKEAVEYLNKL